MHKCRGFRTKGATKVPKTIFPCAFAGKPNRYPRCLGRLSRSLEGAACPFGPDFVFGQRSVWRKAEKLQKSNTFERHLKYLFTIVFKLLNSGVVGFQRCIQKK